jgi:hypothetical protein
MKKNRKGQASKKLGRLTEKETSVHVATLTPKDWKPLFALIPRIQAKKGLGKLKYPKKEDGVFVMPYCEPGRTELEFLELVYGLQLVIEFNWPDWDKSGKIAKKDPDDLNLLTLLKLLTRIVRRDRYCEGALRTALSDGRMLGILKAIRLRVEESNVP